MFFNYKNISSVLAILLVVLLSLSCPIKDNIKEMLGLYVPVETTVNKNYSNSCTYIFAQDGEQVHKKEIKKKPSLLLSFDNTSTFQSFRNVVLDENVFDRSNENDVCCCVPIFIQCRKIII